VHPWHVALVSSRRSSQAVTALGEIVEEVFAPTRIIANVIRGQVIRRPVPYFGPAIFARWDGEDAYRWHEIRDIAAVTAILGGEFPAIVPDDDVERARAWIAEIDTRSAALSDEPPPCAVGDTVLFSYLAFYDLQARVAEIRDRAVGVRVTLIGAETTVYVPFSAILAVVERAPEVTPSRKRKRSRRRHRRARAAAVAIASD
jgi:transcription antitermination factor NusG